MAANKKIEFWLRVVLSALAVCLFFAVQAVYWPVIISLIITFILALCGTVYKGVGVLPAPARTQGHIHSLVLRRPHRRPRHYDEQHR